MSVAGRAPRAELDVYAQTITALARAVEARDAHTGAHIGRVQRYSRRIAAALGVRGDDLWYLEMGAILHDVGKVGVPDAVLTKHGPLKPDEWEAICRHPEIGSRILEDVEGLRPALDAVLYHHERWDGRGYPRGLAGEAIPLAGRIVAVADAFDAMTAARPYRAALPLREAVNRIWRERGSHFDEQVVDVFLRTLPPGLLEAALPATVLPAARASALRAASKQALDSLTEAARSADGRPVGQRR